MQLFEEENKQEENIKPSDKVKKRDRKIKILEEEASETETDIARYNLTVKDGFLENQTLFDSLFRLFTENKMPHSIILEGDAGEDKLNFAFNLCLKNTAFSLNEQIEDIYEKFNKNIFNDILIIKNKNEKQLSIDEIRNINNFIFMKSYLGNPKFIIIDSIDYLNINAANCLLKNLEEPNNGVFFILLYNKIEDPLKTIISRCIKFRFKSSCKESFVSSVSRYENNPQDIDFYALLTENSILYYNIFKANNIIDFYNNIKNSILTKEYNSFIENVNLLQSKIKNNNHLIYKNIIIIKLFKKIFIDIYNNNFLPPEAIEKYNQYIKFFEKISNKNLHLIYYYNLF